MALLATSKGKEREALQVGYCSHRSERKRRCSTTRTVVVKRKRKVDKPLYG